jgi:cell division protein FtsL
MGTHILAALLLALAVLFLAWVRVATLHRGYEMSRLRTQQEALLEEGRALQVEIGTLRSPGKLTDLATRKLGMVPPQQAAVVSGRGGRP